MGDVFYPALASSSSSYFQSMEGEHSPPVNELVAEQFPPATIEIELKSTNGDEEEQQVMEEKRKETGNPKKDGRRNRRYLGIILASCAAIMYSISALIIKILNFEPYNLGVWRFMTVILLTIPFLIHGQFYRKRRTGKKGTTAQDSTPDGKEELGELGGLLSTIWPPNGTTCCLLLQAILGSNAVLFIFFGVEFLEMGDAIVIATSAPVFVTFLSWIYLKERCGLVPVLLALLALFGVAIICKPPLLTGGTQLNKGTFTGVSFSLASMILLTFSYVMIRFLRKVHHALIQLAFALWGLMESLALAVILDVLAMPRGIIEISLVISSAVLAFSAQTCLTLALKYEQAGLVALVRTSEVPFCYLWQFLWLHAKPDLYSVIGAVITLGCVVVAALRKTVLSLEENHPYRRRLAFLLY